MDWNNIWENTISGVLVVLIGGIGAWFAYTLGIRGKERAQNASARKQEIYIPLKYELKHIIDSSLNMWKSIETVEINKIVNNNDEMVVKEEIYKKCNDLLNLVFEYNSINLYNVASNILNRKFEEKYRELRGSMTHIEHRQYGDEELEIEELDYEVRAFYEISGNPKNIDALFNINPLYDEYCYDEYCLDEGNFSPIEEFISRLFSAALPKNKNGNQEKIFVKGFNFYQVFNGEDKVKQKGNLFEKIKECAFDLFEDVQVQIKYIGNRYEKE